jgi:hypothetical protein
MNANFAFITRHALTADQIRLADEAGIDLILVGDMDAFTVTPEEIRALGDFEGVVVVHPAAAMRLAQHYLIGIFANGNRAAEGERPQFYAKNFHVYDLRGQDAK